MENATKLHQTDELSDTELSSVHGGGIVSALTQFAKDIEKMLSTGQGRGGGSGIAAGPA